MANNVFCRFDDYLFNTGEKYYKCSIYDRTILSCDDFTFRGFHLPERTHQDVTYVEFGEPCSKIPPGLTKVFPNMKVLGICNAGLKTIIKEDLAEYKNLERFICENCKVEFLPRDLFEGFENLKYIKFIRNKLKIIEPNILDGLDKLEYVNFMSNPNYSKFYSANPIYVSYSTLEQIKNHLYEQFFTLDKKIIRNYVDNYPDKIEILRIFREKSNEINTNLRMHELTYDFYDQNRIKNVAELEKCETQLSKKLNELEKSNSELIKKIEEYKASESKLRHQIEELSIEVGKERDEKKKLKKNLQTQVDGLANTLQSIMLINPNKNKN